MVAHPFRLWTIDVFQYWDTYVYLCSRFTVLVSPYVKKWCCLSYYSGLVPRPAKRKPRLGSRGFTIAETYLLSPAGGSHVITVTMRRLRHSFFSFKISFINRKWVMLSSIIQCHLYMRIFYRLFRKHNSYNCLWEFSWFDCSKMRYCNSVIYLFAPLVVMIAILTFHFT